MKHTLPAVSRVELAGLDTFVRQLRCQNFHTVRKTLFYSADHGRVTIHPSVDAISGDFQRSQTAAKGTLVFF
jgi:hypothetical protein